MNISPASTSAEASGKLKRHDLLIGGSISPPVGGEYILTDNPYTGKVWGEIARGTSADVDEAAGILAGGKSLWTARVAARSRVRSGRPAQLAIDTTNLQFFDPGSGLAVKSG